MGYEHGYFKPGIEKKEARGYEDYSDCYGLEEQTFDSSVFQQDTFIYYSI
jgi:hypothetical protein